jgi:hypothetical protein
MTDQQKPEDYDIDIVLRSVGSYGYIPIVILGRVEVYRGEFQKTASIALDKAQMFLGRSAVTMC